MARSQITDHGILIAVVLCALALFTSQLLVDSEGGLSLIPQGPLIGGPFTLIDQRGTSVNDSDFEGRFRVVYFGYSRCGDTCVSDLESIGAAIDSLDTDSTTAVPIFITVDPEHDTATVLAAFAARFHPRLVALTGEPEAIAEVAATFGVYYEQTDGTGARSDRPIEYVTMIYLMGPDGDYITHFPPGTDGAALAEALDAYI